MHMAQGIDRLLCCCGTNGSTKCTFPAVRVVCTQDMLQHLLSLVTVISVFDHGPLDYIGYAVIIEIIHLGRLSIVAIILVASPFGSPGLCHEVS